MRGRRIKARGGTARIQPPAGATSAGRVSLARPAGCPIAAGPPSPGGLAGGLPLPPPERAAAAPTHERGAGRRARSVWRRRPRADGHSPSAAAARSPTAPRRPAPPGPSPPARHGVMDHLQAGGVSGLLRVPSLPSFSAPDPRAARAAAAPGPVRSAINTRRPLNLAGTVAAEDACEPAAQDAAAALRGPARVRVGGRGRAGWGARGPRWGLRLAAPRRLCFPGWWDLQGSRMGEPRGHAAVSFGRNAGRGRPSPRSPPRFCQVKMTDPVRAWGAAWRGWRGAG